MTDQAATEPRPAPALTPEPFLQLGLGFWASKTLLSALELGVFTALGSGAATEAELRDHLGLHPRGARDFLDALVALGMLDRGPDGYANTPAGAVFLDRTKPSYVGGMLEFANGKLWAGWTSLTDSLRTGDPKPMAGGDEEDFFTKLYRTPEALCEFLKAMTGLSTGAAIAIAQKFPWDRYQSFCDLGCAQGALPVQVATAHPHLTGIGLDLAPVGPVFDEFVASFGLQNRVRFAAGDFFEGPLPAADVYVMGHIVHDWGAKDKMRLLRNAYESLPDGGALIVHDAIIDDDRRENVFGLLMSLNMLVETAAGFDYTGQDCRGWMAEVGFRKSYVEPLAGSESMVVGIK